LAAGLQRGSGARLEYARCPSCGSADADLRLRVDLRVGDSGSFRCYACGFETSEVKVVKKIMNELISRWQKA